MKYFIYCRIFVLLVSITSCISFIIDESIRQNIVKNIKTSSFSGHEAVIKWKAADKAMRMYLTSIMYRSLPYLFYILQNMNLTSSCSRSLKETFSGIKEMKLWAFKMIDSSGKIPDGILEGSPSSLGDYDECVAISVPNHFRGQYCSVYTIPPLPEREPFVSVDSEIPEFINATEADTVLGHIMKNGEYLYFIKLRNGICVPSTCNAEDVFQLVTGAMKQSGLDLGVAIRYCETKVEKIIFNKTQIAIIILFLALLIAGILGTTLDVFMNLKNNKESQSTLSVPVKCLLCFSFYTNLHRLLKKNDSPDSIKIFHGMKVITNLWVILIHTYVMQNLQSMSNMLEIKEMEKSVLFEVVLNGYLSVVTFFFISATILAYGVMKSKGNKINIPLYIIRRLWRLTPPASLVMACAFLLPLFGTGPIWREIVEKHITERCEAYWWTNILYVNNFISAKDMCLDWYWYLAVDTHLYLLSLIVLIPLKKNPRFAFTLNGIIFFLGILITAISNVYYKLSPIAMFAYAHPEKVLYFVDNGYFKTYLYISTCCIGLYVGSLLATKRRIRLPLFTVVCGWILSFVLGLVVLYGVHHWNQGNTPKLFVSTLYACTSKVIWSLALAWVTVACMTGNGGFIKTFLSWEGFVPLSRLTYMGYLIHPIIIRGYIASSRTILRLEHRTAVHMYFANILMTYVGAFSLTLLFESPFSALDKLFL